MNTQALLEMASLAEEHGVEMKHWLLKADETRSCGTVGCLCGTYAYYHKELNLISTVKQGNECFSTLKTVELRKHLDIPPQDFDWLFLWVFPVFPSRYSPFNLHSATTKPAVARLRKYIYYKLKQAEIHEAWNSRHHTKHAQVENTEFVASLSY